MQITLLGTGSPRPCLARAGACVVVEAAGRAYVVDCGERATVRLQESGIPAARTTRLLFTHLHTDHTLDYANWVLNGWRLGRRELRVFGPPGTARMHRLLFDEVYAEDMAYRRSLGVSTAGLTDVTVEEVPLAPGAVLAEDGVRITTAPVVHDVPTLAYRFDAGDRSVVISGDTVPCDSLIELARGADLLVQDCALDPTTRERFTTDPALRPLWERISREHPDAGQVGWIATEAGVATVALTHLLPDAEEAPTIAAVRRHFNGPVVFGHDLLRLTV